MVPMLVGSLSDVDDVVKTAPWGIDEYVAVRKCRLDGEYGWSLFILTDPNAGHDVEGLVFAVARDKKRAAVIGLAPRRRLYEIVEQLRDTTGGLDLRKVAGLLQRREGMLWGNSPVPENAPS
jgi:hypothetical protein